MLKAKTLRGVKLSGGKVQIPALRKEEPTMDMALVGDQVMGRKRMNNRLVMKPLPGLVQLASSSSDVTVRQDCNRSVDDHGLVEL
jgi:hypothetical protein